MKEQEFLNRLKIVFYKGSENHNQDFFRIVGKEFGVFKLPKVMSLDEVVEDKIFYRGAIKKIFLKELLTDKNEDKLFIGSGISGKGFYVTTNKYRTDIFSDWNENNVLKMYIKDYNIISYGDITAVSTYFRELYLKEDLMSFDEVSRFKRLLNKNEKLEILIKFIKEFDDKTQKKYLSLLLEDPSAIAVILGYDVIKSTLSDDYLILNRGKIHVTSNEFTRITGKRAKKAKKIKELKSQKNSGFEN